MTTARMRKLVVCLVFSFVSTATMTQVAVAGGRRYQSIYFCFTRLEIYGSRCYKKIGKLCVELGQEEEEDFEEVVGSTFAALMTVMKVVFVKNLIAMLLRNGKRNEIAREPRH